MKFTNESDFEKTLDYFGGEKFLKEKFPAILQMLYDTKELHETMNDSGEEENIGYTDTCRIELLPMRNTSNSSNSTNDAEISTSVSARSYMTLKNKASFLHMTGELIDPKSEKVFGAFSVYDTEKHNLEKGMIVTHSLFTQGKIQRVKAKTDFLAVNTVDGKSVCTFKEHQDVWIDVCDIKPEVKNITVEEPKPQSPNDKTIRIVYGNRYDAYAAYSFEKASYYNYSGKYYVDVYYPFVVTVELEEPFYFDVLEPVAFDSTFYLSLKSSVVEGGEVHFNTYLTKNIDYSVSPDYKTLTLSFEYSPYMKDNFWGVQMPLTNYIASGTFDFHLNFQIQYTSIFTPDILSKTMIIVSSESGAASDNFKQIKPSTIVWGCLGKETLIKTDIGFSKISELNIGDKIWTESNGFVPLKNMVVGKEEKIIAISVSSQKTLFITKEHPISTDRGIIRAEEISVGDKLKLEDGTYKEIYYFETIDYNDTVYSPELEISSLICADGIIVGDYTTSPDAVEEVKIENTPLNPELLDQLIKWSKLKEQSLI